MAEIKKINTDLQIEAGLLDGDGNSGTANQILISTGTGVDWVDGSGSSIIGGPYLPLAGGTMTGQLTFPYGFLGDYIYHTGDSNTYFGFSSSDTFSLFTGGSNRLHVNSAGNVGIGTTSPSAKLHLEGDAIIEGVLRADNFNLGLGGAIKLKASNSLTDQYVAFGTTPSGSNGNATFTEKMRINSDGNVGIGTTSPQSKLQLNGGDGLTVTASDGAYTAGYFGRIQSDYGVNALRLVSRAGDVFRATNYGQAVAILTGTSAAGTSEKMRIDSNGNVGIGVTGPNQRLQVKTATTTDSSFQGINVRNNGTVGTRAGICFQGYDWVQSAIWHGRGVTPTSESGALVLGTNPNTSDLTVSGVVARMVINNAGAIKFNAYNSTNNTGTPTYLLGTDASGNIVKTNTVPGSGAGPYLPLAGGTMTGTAGVLMPDNFKLNLGTSSDLQIYHDGSDSFIDDTGTGWLRLRGNGGVILSSYSESEIMLQATRNSSVALYYDNSKKFETTNTGVSVTGSLVVSNDITATGDLDVRDIDARNGIFTGNVGIGTTNPNQKLHVEFANTDTSFSGGSGGDWGSEGIRIENTENTVNTMAMLHLRNNDADIHIAGIRQGSNDSDLGFFFEGTEKARFANNGNVGIGTDSPDSLLDIGTNNIITLDDTGSSTGFIGMGSYNDGTKNRAQGQSYYGFGLEIDRPNQLISFNSYDSNGTTSGGTDILVLKRDGKVGIGTTTPSQKLEVNGAVLAGDYRGSAQIYLTSPDSWIFRSTGGSERMRITSSGNVGIGETNPAAKLHLKGSFNSQFFTQSTGGTTNKFGISSGTAYTSFTVGSSITTAARFYHDNSYITFAENGANVGIGTTSPATKLHVSGANTVMRLSSTSSYVDMIMTNSSNTGFLNLDGSKMNFFVGGGSSGDLKMSIGTNGNVGIGTTSPAVQLELGDNTADEKLRLTGAASGKPLMTFYNTTTKIGQISSSSVGVTVSSLGSGNMTFENGGGARLVIDNSGNVGIADTSPSYKLDVDGTIRATGDVIAYSDVRVKENIKTIDNALEKVNKLRGVEFNKIGSEEKSIGVIAQEIEKVLPEVVKEDDKGMKSVAYGNIVGVLIEAIKDQQKQIDELKSIINGGTK